MITFSQFYENINNKARLVIKKKDGEWVVAWYLGNKIDEDKTYYSGGDSADYKKDCENTMKLMQKEVDKYNAELL